MATKKTLFGKTIKSKKFTTRETYNAALQSYIQKARKIYMSCYEVDNPEVLECKQELDALTDAEFYYYIIKENIFRMIGM